MKLGDRVFVQEPQGDALIPYVGRVVKMSLDGITVYIDVDTTSPLTSNHLIGIARLCGLSLSSMPVRQTWCTVIQAGDHA